MFPGIDHRRIPVNIREGSQTEPGGIGRRRESIHIQKRLTRVEHLPDALIQLVINHAAPVRRFFVGDSGELNWKRVRNAALRKTVESKTASRKTVENGRFAEDSFAEDTRSVEDIG